MPGVSYPLTGGSPIRSLAITTSTIVLLTLTVCSLSATPATITATAPQKHRHHVTKVKPKPAPARANDCRAYSPATPRGYLCDLIEAKWPGQFWAVNEIVTPESGWDPCAVYPSQHDCGYIGSNSCGLPQADPCPSEWQGRLDVTWRAQCRWLTAYFVSHGYGSPVAALRYRQSHGSY